MPAQPHDRVQIERQTNSAALVPQEPGRFAQAAIVRKAWRLPDVSM